MAIYDEPLLATEEEEEETSPFDAFLQNVAIPEYTTAPAADPVEPELTDDRGLFERKVDGLMAGIRKFGPNLADSARTTKATSDWATLTNEARDMVGILEGIEYLTGPDGRLTDEGKAKIQMNKVTGKDTRDPSTIFDDEAFDKTTMSDDLLAGKTVEEAKEAAMFRLQKNLDEVRETFLKSKYTGPEDAESLEALLATEDRTSTEEILRVMGDPEAGVDLVSQSLVASLLVMGGAIAGGAAGTMLPGPGTLAGAAAGGGLVSMNIEQRSALMEGFTKEGVDVFSVDAVMDFVQKNPNATDDIVSEAWRKGAGVGIFDAAAIAVGGKIMTTAYQASAKTLMSKALAVSSGFAAEQLTQGFLGASGAVFGDKLAGHDVNWDEAFLEFWGEIWGSGPVDIVTGYAARVADARKEKKDKSDAENLVDELREEWGIEGTVREDNAVEVELKTARTDTDPTNPDAADPVVLEEAKNKAAERTAPEPGSPLEQEMDHAMEEARLVEEERVAKQKARKQADEEKAAAKEGIAEEVATLEEEQTTQPTPTATSQRATVAGIPVSKAVAGSAQGVAAEVEQLDRRVQEGTEKTTETVEAAASNISKTGKVPTAPEAVEAPAPVITPTDTELAKQAEEEGTVEETIDKPAPDAKVRSQAFDLLTNVDDPLSQKELSNLGKAAGLNIPEEASGITSEEAAVMADAVADKMAELGPEEGQAWLEKAFGGEIDERARKVSRATTPERKAKQEALAEQEREERLAAVEEGLKDKAQKKATAKSAKKALATTERQQRIRKPLRERKPVSTDSSTEEVFEEWRVEREDRERGNLLADTVKKIFRANPNVRHITDNNGALSKYEWTIESTDIAGVITLKRRSVNEDGSARTPEPYVAWRVDLVDRTVEFVEAANGSKATGKPAQYALKILFNAHDDAQTRLNETSPRTEGKARVLRPPVPEHRLREIAKNGAARTRRIRKAAEETYLTRRAEQIVAENSLRRIANDPKHAGSKELRDATASLEKLNTLVYEAQNALDSARAAELTDEQALANIKGAQEKRVAEFVAAAGRAGMKLKDVSDKVPNLGMDGDAKIISLMTEEEFNLVSKSEHTDAVIIQILPDGRTRTARLDANYEEANAPRGRSAYTATVVESGAQKLDVPEEIGATGFLFNKNKLKIFQQAVDARRKSAEELGEDAWLIEQYGKAGEGETTKASRPKAVDPTHKGMSDEAINATKGPKENRSKPVPMSNEERRTAENARRVSRLRAERDLYNAVLQKKQRELADPGEAIELGEGTAVPVGELEAAFTPEEIATVEEMEIEEVAALLKEKTRELMAGLDTQAKQQMARPRGDHPRKAAIREKGGEEIPANQYVAPESLPFSQFREAWKRMQVAETEDERTREKTKLKEKGKYLLSRFEKADKRKVSKEERADKAAQEKRSKLTGAYMIARMNHLQMQQVLDEDGIAELAKRVGVSSKGDVTLVIQRIKAKTGKIVDAHVAEVEANQQEETPSTPEERRVSAGEYAQNIMAASAARKKVDPASIPEADAGATTLVLSSGQGDVILAHAPSVDKFLATREGRSLMNMGYIREMIDELRTRGLNNNQINSALKRIYRGVLKGDVLAAQEELIDQAVVKDAAPATLDSELEVMEAIKDSQDATTNIGVMLRNAVKNVRVLKGHDIAGVSKYFPGIDTFSQTPAYRQRELADELAYLGPASGETLTVGERARRTPQEYTGPRTAPDNFGVDLRQRPSELELEEDMAWKQASEANTRTAYQAYMDKYPGSIHARAARERVETISEQRNESSRFITPEKLEAAWEQLRSSGTVRSGVDPKDLQAMLVITAAYIERGVRSFADLVKTVGESGVKVTADLRTNLGIVWDDLVARNAYEGLEPRTTEELPTPTTTARTEVQRDTEGSMTSVLDGETLAETEEKINSKLTPEARLEAELGGKKNEEQAAFENENVRGADVAGDKGRWFQSPQIKTLGSYIMAGIRSGISSASTLPRDMKQAAEILRKATSATNAAAIWFQQWQGEYLNQLEDAGIKPGSRDHLRMNRAITAYVENMNDASIEKEFGIAIPQAIKDSVAPYIAHKNRLAMLAAKEEALPFWMRSAIDKNNGEGWLHKSFHSRPFLTSLLTEGLPKNAIERLDKHDPRIVEQIVKAAHKAYGIPSDPAMLRMMPKKHLKYIARNIVENDIEQDNKVVIQEKYAVLNKKGEPVIDRETGEPKVKTLYLDDASAVEIADYIIRKGLSEDQIRTHVRTSLISMYAKDTGGKQVLADVGGSGTLSRSRKLMFSHSQQIEKLINAMLSSPVIKNDPNISDALKERRKEIRKAVQSREDFLRTFSRSEFIDWVQTQDPEGYGRVVERVGAQFEIADLVRKGLEEVTDPGELLRNSGVKLEAARQMSNALSEIVAMGLKSGSLSYSKSRKDEHTHALGFHGELTTGRESGKAISGLSGIIIKVESGQEKGSVPLIDPDTGMPRIFGDKYTIVGLHDLLRAHSATYPGVIMSNLYRVASLAKYDKVVLNPLAHPRNVMGSLMIGIGRGVLLGSPSSWGLASDAAWSDFRASWGTKSSAKVAERKMNKPALKNFSYILAERGIFHNSVRAGAIADLYGRWQAMPADDFAMSLAQSTNMVPNKDGKLELVDGKASNFLAQAGRIADEAFRLEDEGIKGVAFLQRTRQYMTILQGSNVLPEGRDHGAILQDYLETEPLNRASLNQEERDLVERAMDLAEINVLATFPTFSKASRGIRSLSRNPVIGAFPTFQYEMVRNTVNQYIQMAKLMGGYLPDGTKLTDPVAIKKARSMGTVLGLNQLLWNMSGSLLAGATSAFTIAAAQHGRDTDDEDFAKEAVKAGLRGVAAAIGDPLDMHNMPAFRNVMSVFDNDSMLMLVPGTIDTVNGTMDLVKLGWTVPEGAWIEAQYGFLNDISRIMSNDDMREGFKQKMVTQSLKSFLGRLKGVIGNEEVLFRSVFDNFEEKDGATTENQERFWSRLERSVNQYLRGVFGDATDPTVERQPGQTGESGVLNRLGSGLLASSLDAVPGTTLAKLTSQAVEGTYNALNSPEGMTVDMFTKLAGSAAGIRYQTYDYKEEYPKRLKWDHIPQLEKSTSEMYSELFDLNKADNYETAEEFAQMYNLMNGYRMNDLENLSNGLIFGRDVMGMKIPQMRDMWGEVRGADAYTEDVVGMSVVGHNLNDLLNKRLNTGLELFSESDAYHPTIERHYREWEAAGRRKEFIERINILRGLR